jgi:hypothetical protein
VICRIQDQSMLKPASPAQGVTVELSFYPEAPSAPNIAPLSAQTGPDGIAAFTFQINDPASGVPVAVQAAANYGGASYVAQTFFTPNPGANGSPTPCASPGPGTPPTGGGPGGCSGGGHP